MSIADDLTRLADLRDRDVLTEAEFEIAKARLLAAGDDPISEPAVVLAEPEVSSDVLVEVKTDSSGALGETASGPNVLVIIGVFVLLAVGLVALASSASKRTPPPSAYDDLSEADPLGDTTSMMADPMMDDIGSGSPTWNVWTDVSPIDDSKSVYAQLRATTPVYYSYGKSYQPVLTLRCMEGKTSAYIDWGEFLGSDETSVETRIDDAASRSRSWAISTDNTSAGLWNGGSAVPFIKSLVGADQLVVRVVPYSESAVTATFAVAGLEPHAKAIADACGWAL